MNETETLLAERERLRRTIAELVAVLMDLTDPLSETTPAMRVLNAKAAIAKALQTGE